jgi:hypothetical protein
MYDICPRLRYEAEEFLIRTGYPKVAKKSLSRFLLSKKR